MAAGNVSAFIYELMREELPVERVRALVARATDPDAGGHVIPELSELADRFTVRLLQPPEGAVSEPAAEEEPLDEGAASRIVATPDGVLTQAGGEPLSQEMAEFVADFDERMLGPEFVAAVNEAAERGMNLSLDTAHLVADRVREMRAQAAAAGSEG